MCRYENVFTMKFGSKGQIPYIELNGEEIPDSNIIISRFVFYILYYKTMAHVMFNQKCRKKNLRF